MTRGLEAVAPGGDEPAAELSEHGPSLRDPSQWMERTQGVCRQRHPMGDVAVMPLYWFVNPILAVKAVRVPPVAGGEVTANFFNWDKS